MGLCIKELLQAPQTDNVKPYLPVWGGRRDNLSGIPLTYPYEVSGTFGNPLNLLSSKGGFRYHMG